MGGVPVAISALGAPFSVSQNTFSDAFGVGPLPEQHEFYSSLVTASVCASYDISQSGPVRGLEEMSIFLETI